MNKDLAEEWLCKAHCNYYKPNRTEDERCRGFELASTLFSQKALPITISVGPFDPVFKQQFLRDVVCTKCPFFIDGCDFVSPDSPRDCVPCGGLVLISSLLKKSEIRESDIQLASVSEPNPYFHLGLSPECALKHLEEYYVYQIKHDDLYEVNEDAFQFLQRNDSTGNLKIPNPDPEFVAYCIEEGLLAPRSDEQTGLLWRGTAPVPSLRYLEWLVTLRCNLRCAHCYLGEAVDQEFPRELIYPLLKEFSTMQGLRILVSGGEPTLYRHFEFLNDIIDEYPVRFVLLTNGLTMNDRFAKRLKFHEVQISLDGMKRGHEAIRGQGTFAKVLSAMDSVKNAGLDLSIATMVHRENIGEWDEMERIIEHFGVKEWNIDYPCKKGRWELHPHLFVEEKQASECMKYGFGGSYHGTDEGWTCGHHLAAVLPAGDICRCALYADVVLGNVNSGLREAWQRVQHIPISETACNGCLHANECGGGCRYRAGGLHERDGVMCAMFSTDASPED